MAGSGHGTCAGGADAAALAAGSCAQTTPATHSIAAIKPARTHRRAYRSTSRPIVDSPGLGRRAARAKLVSVTIAGTAAAAESAPVPTLAQSGGNAECILPFGANANARSPNASEAARIMRTARVTQSAKKISRPVPGSG
ncbi:MAG TPA: hypothetical protein VJ724_02720 [Tahibacter sp.]|nr:hypothetical protein [Tahibacter sp.]